jgi:hypothetical protein
MKAKPIIYSLAIALSLAAVVQAQSPSPADNAIPVTVDNFNRAESDMYFASSAKEADGVGKLLHRREVVPVEKQPVVRPNGTLSIPREYSISTLDR